MNTNSFLTKLDKARYVTQIRTVRKKIYDLPEIPPTCAALSPRALLPTCPGPNRLRMGNNNPKQPKKKHVSFFYYCRLFERTFEREQLAFAIGVKRGENCKKTWPEFSAENGESHGLRGF